MGVEKSEGSEEAWSETIGEEKAFRSTNWDGANESGIGKERVCDHKFVIVSAIVCEQDGGAYFVEGVGRIWVGKKGRE